MALRKGTAVGPYRIGTPLFGTSLAELYRANDDRSDASRTIMCRKIDGLAFEEGVFRDELERLQGLHHACLPRIFEGGVHGHVLWVCMEDIADTVPLWTPGEAARSALEVITFAATVGEAFKQAAMIGVHHGDLTPTCLRKRKGGSPLVVGLGSARLFVLDQATVLRSARYRAPEQILQRDVNTPTDIYAMGMCMRAAISGQEPPEPRVG